MARVEAAASFRIGEQNKFYEYYRLIDVEINDKPVYRCIRDKDKGNGLLFLYYHNDGMWISVSADRWASSKQDIVNGVKAFKADKDVDIREPGNHDWYMLPSGSRKFQTTVFKKLGTTKGQRTETGEPEEKRPETSEPEAKKQRVP